MHLGKIANLDIQVYPGEVVFTESHLPGACMQQLSLGRYFHLKMGSKEVFHHGETGYIQV